MNKVFSISVNEVLWRDARMSHSNLSQYIEELMKADLYKLRQQAITDAVFESILSNPEKLDALRKALQGNTSYKPIGGRPNARNDDEPRYTPLEPIA